MALDDPTVLLAIVLLVLLIGFQFLGRGNKKKKRNGFQSLGFAVIALGILVLVLLDFLTAFVFFSVGVGFMMVGEFVSKLVS